MPFIPRDRRPPLLTGDLEPSTPGDACFLVYSRIMAAWRRERRWTTIHSEFKRAIGATDEEAAKFLAFLEFYIREAHTYELEMEEKNGGI